MLNGKYYTSSNGGNFLASHVSISEDSQRWWARDIHPSHQPKKTISSCWKSWKRRIRIGWDENLPIIPRIQWNIGCISNRTITFWNMLGQFSTEPWLWEKIHEGISLFLPHHQRKLVSLKYLPYHSFTVSKSPIYKSHRLTFLVEWAVWYLCLVLSPKKMHMI